MKLTKKQLSALQRIVGREQTRYDGIQLEPATILGLSLWRL